MKIHTIEQGTPEWKELRQGKITGTDVGPFCLDPKPIGLTVTQIKDELDRLGMNYKKIALRADLIALLPGNGYQYSELSKAARNLLITKITDKKPKDAWQIAQADKEDRQMQYMIQIQRGNQLEPAARLFYERKTGLAVEQVGFVSSDCGKYGMSPDGLILENGAVIESLPELIAAPVKIIKALEIKCPMPSTHRQWLLDNYNQGTVPSEHFYQCQMAMVVCECESVDFLSFCPGEAPLLITLYRSRITEELAEGLSILAEEMDVIENSLASMWDAEYGSPEGEKLRCYPNGNPIYSPAGVMLDQDGSEVIVDGQEYDIAEVAE